MIIYVLFSFLGPFSCDLLGRRLLAEALLECQKSSGPFLLLCLSSKVYYIVSFEWTDAKGGGWGGLKVSVEMVLSSGDWRCDPHTLV